MKKILTVLFLITTILIMASSIVIRVPQDPDFLDPHKASAAGTYEMMFNVFEGLLKPTPNGGIIPAVAKDYTVSKDGLVYTFTIRDNIKFHNEKYVTIQDVEYSLNRLRGKDAKALSSDFEKFVKDVKVIDSKTIQVFLNQTNSDFLAKFTEPILPKDNINHNENPIGTGPYKFVKYSPGQSLKLKKFDNYWINNYANIDNVEFRIISDDQSALLAFFAGEIQVFPRINDLQADLLDNRYNIVRAEQNLVQIMAMNNNREPFNDIRVRKAINYAINKDQIIALVANGHGTKLGSNMSPIMKEYYQSGLENYYSQNIQKAKELLKEAGYPNGFSTSVTVPSNYKFHVDTAQVIVEQLKQIGINLKIKQVEWGVWLEKVYSKRDFDSTIIAFTGKLSPYDVLKRYQSNYPRNFMNYKNTKYDELISKAIKETNNEKRIELYKNAQTILTQDAPAVFIMDPNITIAMDKNVKGYTLYPLYIQDISKLYFSK